MLQLETSDWQYNAGLVGLYKILESYYPEKNDFEAVLDLKQNNVMEIDEAVFENFSEKYFGYLIKYYHAFMPLGKILNNHQFVEDLSNKTLELNDDTLKKLNKIIETNKTKLSSASFNSAYAILEETEILNLVKELKKINLKKNQKPVDAQAEIDIQLNVLLKIYNIIQKEDIKKILFSKEFIYNFTGDFLSNVSVWGKNGAKGNAYEVFNEYFVDKAFKYLQADDKNFKDSCTSCGRKINSSNAFDLTWINETGVDGSRKSSHYWNFNDDTIVCPICNIIYSCIPIGFNYLNGKGFFINDNSNIKALMSINKLESSDYTDNDISTLEMKSYFNVAKAYDKKGLDQLDKEIQNIQVIKLDSNNTQRLYTFNQLDKKTAYIITLANKSINNILKYSVQITEKEYFNVYDEVIKAIFNNQNLYHIIHKIIALKGSINKALDIIDIQKKILFINYKTEGEKMEKGIEVSKFCGRDLKKAYFTKGKKEKIDTLTYRLLNALKVKNASKFLDIVINAYMSVDLEIPNIFINTIKNEEMLLAYGYAFVLGLKSEENNKNTESKTESMIGEKQNGN